MFLLSALILLLVQQNAAWNLYCNLNCGSIENTVCGREPCRKAKTCGPKFKMLKMTNADRNTVLTVHNNFRQYIAWGNITDAYFGAAANMRALSYSKELEFIAQCWANDCLASGAHDECRRSQLFQYVGQNLYMEPINNTRIVNTNMTGAIITMWFDEYLDVEEHMVKSFPKKWSEFSKIGHFSQLAWAKTYGLGCAKVMYGRGRLLNYLLVCNYGPGGNAAGEPVFELGPTASNCPKDAPPNLSLNGLCGRVRTLDDKFKPPFVMGKGCRCGRCVSVVLAAIFIHFYALLSAAL